ncbi:NAD-binding protein [Sporolituus thermophilus]|uniref:TrkA-N domain-containing protein n=1 Tax=Sporolituus thermophilus DSM 23256 TaxID=1123285 RepID=A0A1G7J751_9FIRM|nr:NAD-binding protein [Sporolituus thermophilus]SDF20802.1 TrkA-N domain-containing protein [Sporolituus thermophilus DSM 23256]
MRVVIVGAGKVGYSLAQRLSEENHEVVVIEKDEERRSIVQNNLDVMTMLVFLRPEFWRAHRNW